MPDNTLARRAAAEKFERTLYALMTVAASLFIALYLYVSLRRVSYPYELEWMEGGSVDHVARIVNGEKLYVEPSPQFVPFIYTPVYFYTAAGVAKVTGVGFFALRIVSLVASLGCFLLIGRFVYRETANPALALLGAGLFAATFVVSGRWFDLGRVDSLFLMLVLAGAYTAKYWRSMRGAVVAGTLLGLAFLTKQTALVVAAGVSVGVFCRRPKQGLVLGSAFLFVVGGSMILLNDIHDGWYTYYVLRLPRQHAIAFEFLSRFWTRDVLAVAVTFGAAFVHLSLRVFRRSGTSKQDTARDGVWFDLFFWGSMFASAWLSRLHSGGYDNVLFPLYAAVAIGAPPAICALRERQSNDAAGKPCWCRIASIGVLTGTLVQLGFMVYSPNEQIPSASHRNGWQELVERVKSFEGRVAIPYHGFVTTRTHGTIYSQQMAAVDVLRGHESPIRERLEEAFRNEISSQAYDAIILDVRQWNQEVLLEHYNLVGSPISNPDALRGLTGDRSYRPWLLFTPKRDGPVARRP